MLSIIGLVVTAVFLILASGCEDIQVRDVGLGQRQYRPARMQPGTLTVSAGMRIRVRLREMLDSDRTRAGQRFTTSSMEDVRSMAGAVAIPGGSVIHGYVAEVTQVVNRTSMRLRFDFADLADGRRVPLTAEPAQESGIEMDDLAEKGLNQAKGFLIERGIDAATGGVLLPVWLYMRAKTLHGFVTQESRMVFPKDCILTIELSQPAYVPPPRRASPVTPSSAGPQ